MFILGGSKKIIFVSVFFILRSRLGIKKIKNHSMLSEKLRAQVIVTDRESATTDFCKTLNVQATTLK
jgi:hypothetical protein